MLGNPSIFEYRKVTISKCGQSAGKPVASFVVRESSFDDEKGDGAPQRLYAGSAMSRKDIVRTP